MNESDQQRPRGRFKRYALIALAVIVGLGGGYLLRMGCAPSAPVSETAISHDHAAMKKQVWVCPMNGQHPYYSSDKPGKCIYCDMTLVPEEQAEPTTRPVLTVSPEAAALMSIETSPVQRKFVSTTIRMIGKVDYDETKLGYITAWIPGRLDRLFVDYTGISVKKGEHMVELYSPELLSAQEELLQAIAAVRALKNSESKLVRETTEDTVTAAREKLRLWGLTPEQVKQIEARGKPSDHMTIYAPMGGVVVHKNAEQGMYVQTGTRIYTIADLATVWVKLDAYESDLMWLRYGQPVTLTSVAYPGKTFRGIISFINPILNIHTRTVPVRINVPNPDGLLKPGMFVTAVVYSELDAAGKVMAPDLVGKWTCSMHPKVLADHPGKCPICGMSLVTTESLGYVSVSREKATPPLVIPASAPLITGTRAVVYVKVPDAAKPTFEGREITLGPRAGDYYIVDAGLRTGEQVVTRGNFLIDSALQIQAKPSMMDPNGTAMPAMKIHKY